MHRSTSAVRRACAVGTTVALVGLTTGLGIMSATAASAVEPTDSTQPVSSNETTAPVATETPAPTDEPSVPADETTETPAPAPAEETPAPTPSDDATTPADEQTTPATTAPAAETPAPTATPTPDVTTKAADATVTIDGAAKVGTLLSAVVTGFDEDSSYKYVWADQDRNVLSKTATYRIDPTDVRKTITVTVTGTLPGATETTSVTSDATAPVSQTPAFLGEDGKPTKAGAHADHPLELSTTAGDAFSHTFRAQGFPEPKYALAWFDEDELEDTTYYDENGDEYVPEPDEQLPDGITFDASTGELSGVSTEASDWTFAVTATSGTETVTQYVDLTVEAAAPLGIIVFTTDRAGAFDLGEDEDDTSTRTSWIIDPEGKVYTFTITGDGEGGYTGNEVEGGRPTIKQGGTLVVSGGLVDVFGNEITDENEESIVPTVTSDVASDVIAPDPDLGFFGLVNVTFPHASIHNLSVSAGDFTTSFAVDVQPTAVPTVPGVSTPVTPVPAAAPVTPTNRGGQLAYTGSDATGALPWALGLLVAGAGLIGARTLRRRRAQR
ncbi:putative Ig domain-containing protein [Curtobacterium sp. PhB142]|uniref:putative Ig domain-containing protein n=1 Tax=unclassified Curtobacterium TaxID=257496 RepID=UPI001044B6F0|nr:MULTISPECIES: putative Ig domain-containing protein [unclassified Curtobacterium]TCL85255.1 putative Ig domain-containing protein [Curtobacterium sp. PhB142]TCM01814.1 putative Ig domain-containing protein [Curtobacterium sp. PhB134]TCU45673.1 putative Ig domain-containing protein [Curtobacterium sp. PhB146]TDW42332.1 putative Ig domain-containing protein [Curtobacterium sp. PhB42]TDW52858.1 putative Ig domain-containing protein [Curtobacterium sp. PhB190]